jgi:ribosomal protein L12E/L44/L45/RPP1/RPP2
MADELNINVLVTAKEEYTKQLVYLLSPEIYKILHNIFIESQQMKKKRSVSIRNYQILLKKIPLWNNIIIEQNTKEIKEKIPYLLDLITAIFISHVKILACVKLKSDSKNIQVKVPNLDIFIHKIIITNAEKIYYNPYIILQKKEKVIELISETIEDTIRNQIPIDKILTEYLSGIFESQCESTSNIHTSSAHASSTHASSAHASSTNNYDNDESESEESESEESESEESDQEEEIPKNIIPTRPLPKIQTYEDEEDYEVIPNNNLQETNKNLINNNNSANIMNNANLMSQDEDSDDEESNDKEIQAEIKKEQIKKNRKVLFADATEKTINNQTDDEDDD